MNVLQINNIDRQGGAARAMIRLHNELLGQGNQSRLLVGRRLDDSDPNTFTISEVGANYLTLADHFMDRYGGTLEEYCGIHPFVYRSSLKIHRTQLFKWADVIVLRNLHGRYFNIWALPKLSVAKPVVWRLPDAWALTGHCAFPYECERWRTGCYRCPMLRGEERNYVEPTPTYFDCTRWVWRAKLGIYRNSKLHIVATTEWMKRSIYESILRDAASVTVISNGVDLNVFKPETREVSRLRLGLPIDIPIVLFAAGGLAHPRKGYRYAAEAMKQFDDMPENKAPMLVTMGHVRGMDKAFPLKRVKHFGFVEDAAQQAMLYATADVFLCPTLAEGQPQVALEALACGAPVVAFDVGPMPEIVIPGETGYLASLKNTDDLARCINLLLDDDKCKRMRIACRKFAEKGFDLTVQTKKYFELFQGIL